jgi:3-deoxy-D-manno-octulosonic-acid transferase
METELWFNLIHACQQQAVPLLLLNARLSERSAHGYAKLGQLTQQGLNSLTAVAAQTADDASRLQQLGANNVSVMGNIKFEVTPPDSALENGLALRNALHAAERPVLLTASTRADNGIAEEGLILDAVAQANIPDLLTIIVPRHPQRFDEVAELLKKRGLGYVRRSDLPNTNTGAAYVLGDSMGEMFSYYAACDVAFIGGSLLPLGGQNLIEALTMGKPVLIGPHTFNFAQATQSAIEAGAAQRVQGSHELAEALKTLFAEPAKRQAMSSAIAGFTEKNRGATERAIATIQQNIKH